MKVLIKTTKNSSLNIICMYYSSKGKGKGGGGGGWREYCIQVKCLIRPVLFSGNTL